MKNLWAFFDVPLRCRQSAVKGQSLTRGETILLTAQPHHAADNFFCDITMGNCNTSLLLPIYKLSIIGVISPHARAFIFLLRGMMPI